VGHATISILGMVIGWVVHEYIVRESIPARQNLTHTRIHKRSWVWICIHIRTRRVSAIGWIPVTRPSTTILAFNTKQQFYHISKKLSFHQHQMIILAPNNMSWIKIEK
jgi:hypothetical protein